MATLNVGTITYTVDANTAKLLETTPKATGAIDSLTGAMGKTDTAASKTQFQLTQTAQAAKQLGAEAQAAQNPLGGLGRALAGIATVQGAMSLVTMAEQYGEMSERVRMASSSAAEYEMVQGRLLEGANATYRSLKESQELYILTADSLRSMGYSTEQALDIVDSMAFSFVKNATSVDRAQSSISAFTGAIMTGKLEADAWKTIIAGMPTIVNDLAQSMGVSAEQVRLLGATGKLTAQNLSEGLRGSLDENKAAAAGMATTVKDAFTQLNNTLSVFVGEGNMATGVTGTMSKAVMLLAENLEVLIGALTVAGAGALAKFVAVQGAALLASARAALAARAEAAEQLKLATAHATTTAATLAHATAQTGLTASTGAAAAAATANTAALTAQTAAQKAAQAAGVGLIGVLGGPVGIIALLASAATAVWLFGRNSEGAVVGVDKLTEGIEKLSEAQLKQRRNNAAIAIDELTKSARQAESGVKGLEKDLIDLEKAAARGVNVKGIENVRAALVDAQAESDTAVQKLQQAFDAEKKLYDEQQKRATKPTGSGAPAAAADPEVKKRLDSMREELELAKLTGEARAKLQAIQKLGANATAEERAEAERLAAQIFKLEEGRKSATKAGTEAAAASKKAAEEKKKEAEKIAEAQAKEGETLRDLAKQIVLANLHGQELAETQAVLSMGVYATEEQIEAARTLGAMLFQANQQRALFDKVGADPKKYVQGDVKPLAGGQFDEQHARYEAEALAEQERYAGQLERLRESMEAQRVTQEEYYSIFEGLQQQHVDRVAQIEKAKQDVMMATGEKGLASLADGLKSAFGEQNALYKAAFLTQKAFAIAQSMVAIQQGIALAAANPWPMNLGAMASVAAATGSIISAISSVSMGGGRQYGGSVDPSKMYRINENGAPEVFNAGNGQQFMLPNTRGQVVSNRDATSSGASPAPIINLNFIEDRSRGGQVEQQQGNDGETMINVWVADLYGGGKSSTALEQTYGLTRTGR